MKILLVEDHRDLRIMVADYFVGRGFLVDSVGTLEEGRAALSSVTYDMLFLDLGLPDGDGRDLLDELPGLGRDVVPTIVMTARDSLEERLASLNGGADDYLPKPFSFQELEARLRAVLRRSRTRRSQCLVCGTLSYDLTSREVLAQGASVDVSKREADLLEALLRAAGRVVSREFLEQHLYPFNDPVTPNALDVTVSRLRRRLTSASADVRIETKRGIGYRLIAGCEAA